MASTNYAYNDFNQHTASAYGKSLHISTKVAINICNAVRHKSVAKALSYLEAVVNLDRAVPFTRFNDGVGHRRGKMASGRFPVKAAKEISAIIKSASSNAENKGFASELKIVHICAQRASQPMHQGRQRRRSSKRTHIEVVVKELDSPKAKAKENTTLKKDLTKKTPTPATQSKKQSENKVQKKLEQEKKAIQKESEAKEVKNTVVEEKLDVQSANKSEVQK